LRSIEFRYPLSLQFDTRLLLPEIGLRKLNCETIMKRTFIAFFAGVALAAYADPPGKEETLETQTARRAQETPTLLKEERPNQVTVGRLTYSGIAVQAVKAENPLQLINPAAPAEYGSAEDNLVREPTGGKPAGLKLFAISF